MSAKFLLIDYENIQKVNLTDLQEDMLVKVFLGQNQKSIPFELVQEAQRRGQSLDWLKIEGNGNNALDFHIAFYLGKLQAEHQAASFIILSKDKGFDPLVTHINKSKANCRRIESLFELPGVIDNLFKDGNLKTTIKNLLKIEKNKRPRKRNTLKKHISTIFNKKMADSKVDELINNFFINNLISESGGKLAYKF